VNTGASLPNQLETVITVPSYRQIVNLADLKASLSGHAPGQSGHPGSKHYADFIKSWLNVEHHPQLFERGMIEDNAEGILLLNPHKD
jgi:penicillin G amidase